MRARTQLLRLFGLRFGANGLDATRVDHFHQRDPPFFLLLQHAPVENEPVVTARNSRRACGGEAQRAPRDDFSESKQNSTSNKNWLRGKSVNFCFGPRPRVQGTLKSAANESPLFTNMCARTRPLFAETSFGRCAGAIFTWASRDSGLTTAWT